MFCFQCQETLGNKGCTANGVCGKKSETANLQDLLIYVTKGISVILTQAGQVDRASGRFITKALFTTVTNVNFDNEKIVELIKEGLTLRETLKERYNIGDDVHDSHPGAKDTMTGH